MPNTLPLLVVPGTFLFLGLNLFFKKAFPYSGAPRITIFQARLIGLLMLLPAVVVWGGLILISAAATSPNQYASSVKTLSDVTLALVYSLAFGLVILYVINRQAKHSAFQQSPLPDIVTVREAAAYLKVGEAEIVQQIQTGRLRATWIGGEYRIHKDALDQFMRG